MKRNTAFLVIALFLALFVFVKSCVIINPQPQACDVVSATIIKILEGPTYDIVFHVDGSGSYYINRGMEQGLNLDSLNAKVLNKTVTLHLPKMLFGTSKHITQMAIGSEIIFTEFD